MDTLLPWRDAPSFQWCSDILWRSNVAPLLSCVPWTRHTASHQPAMLTHGMMAACGFLHTLVLPSAWNCIRPDVYPVPLCPLQQVICWKNCNSVRLLASIPHLCQGTTSCAFLLSQGTNVFLGCQLTNCSPSVALHNSYHQFLTIGWMFFGWWTLLHTHMGETGCEIPSNVAVLDTLKLVSLAPTIPCSKVLQYFVLPIPTLNDIYTRSMSQGLTILI